MRKPKKEIQLTSYDELLGINEAEQNTLNQIVEVPLNTFCRQISAGYQNLCFDEY